MNDNCKTLVNNPLTNPDGNPLITSSRHGLTSFQGERALVAIGNNIRTARLRRRDTEEAVAQRVGVSRHTWRRLEQGLPTVSLGLFVEAMVIYGFERQLFDLANPDLDHIGKSMEAMHRPQRGIAK